MTLENRAAASPNAMGKRLFEVMLEKKSNLSVSADVTTKAALLDVADRLGPLMCVLKTHIDIITDFDEDLTQQLRALADKHNFLIFEDRKFADIGNTVKNQYQGGIYHIAEWADIINAHVVPGPGIIEGLAEIGLPRGAGLLLLAQMSSKGTLAEGSYTNQAVAMVQANQNFVMGFISRTRLCDNSAMIHMTPGVKLQAGGDGLGQQYITPEKAIEDGNDIIIVGRGIIEADDPVGIASQYRDRAWNSLLNRRGY